MKFVNLDNLRLFYAQLKNVFASKTHTHNKTDINNVVDDATINGYQLNLMSNGKVLKTVNLPKEFDVTLTTRTIVPTTSNQTIASRTLITGTQTIQGDANLTSNKILRGANNNLISIFGVQGTVDRMKKIVTPNDSSYFYGIQVADVARSYHLARVKGIADFQYSQEGGLFNGLVTNSVGHCLIDCSGFANLVLRGIDYDRSPYKGATGTPNKAFNETDIINLVKTSPYVWADEYLDKQVDPEFKDIGIPNCRSIRTAAQLAEYYYEKGFTLYEFETSPTSIPTGLRPGDLVFWSKASGSDGQKSRFKAITHVGVVGRNTSRFYQVTGSATSKGDTVFYSEFYNSSKNINNLTYISLIVRPYYHPIKSPITPIGVELFPTKGYDDLGVEDSLTRSGVTFTINSNGGFTTQGKATSAISFYIYESSDPVVLERGTYTLSGVPVHPQVVPGSTNTRWSLVVKGVDGIIYGRDNGAGATFTLTENTEIYVYFYISTDLTDVNSYVVNPSLIRNS